MRSLNEVSINQPSDLIERFALCVDGNINDTSLGFLHSINKENPGGLTDLIRKLRNIQVKLHADALHLIIQVLTDQLKMPLNTMQSIQEFLEKSETREALKIKFPHLLMIKFFFLFLFIPFFHFVS